MIDIIFVHLSAYVFEPVSMFVRNAHRSTPCLKNSQKFFS